MYVATPNATLSPSSTTLRATLPPRPVLSPALPSPPFPSFFLRYPTQLFTTSAEPPPTHEYSKKVFYPPPPTPSPPPVPGSLIFECVLLYWTEVIAVSCGLKQQQEQMRRRWFAETATHSIGPALLVAPGVTSPMVMRVMGEVRKYVWSAGGGKGKGAGASR